MHTAYFLPAIACLPRRGHTPCGRARCGGDLSGNPVRNEANDSAGTYRLPEGGIVLRDLHDVEIDGTGVTLIATDLKSSALKLANCRNVKLKGFTIDYDPLPFTQGTITAVDAKARTVDFETHEGYHELPRLISSSISISLRRKGTGGSARRPITMPKKSSGCERQKMPGVFRQGHAGL